MVEQPRVARGRGTAVYPRPRDEEELTAVAATPDTSEEVLPSNGIDALAVRRSNAQWIGSLIYFVFGVIEITIAIRIFLKLIAANTTTGFTRLIYGLSGPFVAPFKNIVNTPVADNGATFEASSLLAIVIYLILSWLLVRLLMLVIARPTGDGYGMDRDLRGR